MIMTLESCNMTLAAILCIKLTFDLLVRTKKIHLTPGSIIFPLHNGLNSVFEGHLTNSKAPWPKKNRFDCSVCKMLFHLSSVTLIFPTMGFCFEYLEKTLGADRWPRPWYLGFYSICSNDSFPFSSMSFSSFWLQMPLLKHFRSFSNFCSSFSQTRWLILLFWTTKYLVSSCKITFDCFSLLIRWLW